VFSNPRRFVRAGCKRHRTGRGWLDFATSEQGVTSSSGPPADIRGIGMKFAKTSSRQCPQQRLAQQTTQRIMKTRINACWAIALCMTLPLAAQQQTTETTETTRSAGGVTETTTTTTTTFNPEVRTKVVNFFASHKSHPHGLPPGLTSKVKVREVPAAWRTSRIEPGVVISETQRSYLVEAPPELVKVLPAPASGIHYYVAGSNVVAVDPSFKIVDSVQVPSIKYEEDDDEVEIEAEQNGRKTEIEIDKDDGEVEIEEDD
jgi:hypothetical protein